MEYVNKSKKKNRKVSQNNQNSKSKKKLRDGWNSNLRLATESPLGKNNILYNYLRKPEHTKKIYPKNSARAVVKPKLRLPKIKTSPVLHDKSSSKIS